MTNFPTLTDFFPCQVIFFGELVKNKYFQKCGLTLLESHRRYSAEKIRCSTGIKNGNCFYGEQYGTVKKRRCNRRYLQKPPLTAETFFWLLLAKLDSSLWLRPIFFVEYWKVLDKLKCLYMGIFLQIEINWSQIIQN